MTSTTDDVILLDDTLTETFLTDLQSRGRTEETLKCYRNSIGKLRGFLPGHRLSHDAMLQWPDALREQGYCPSTVNSAVSEANSLLAFCGSLKEELLAFAAREGISAGPVFVTRRGTPVGRTTVTALIQALSHDARVEPGKCTPRCLRKLYLRTQEQIQTLVSTLAQEEYEKLLRDEQQKIGWEE